MLGCMEAPVLWFSAAQDWEPTASRAIRTGSEVRVLSDREHEERFGCIRFGLPANDLRLIDWDAACKAAGIPPRLRQALERSGRARGVDPVNWWGSWAAV